ncbi:MAG: dipicolinate synthase [Oscillospiraceae bacterium]|jgi:dipicolinate synthase subunit A|nr:dipicolinate synthase [Oscillospiraceae bacterium]
MTRTFTVVGGDERFVKLRELLISGAYKTTDSLKDADAVILPLPFRWSDEIMDQLRPSQLIFAGRVSREDSTRAKAKGLILHDYFAREELAVANSVATAEGSVEIAIRETPIALWNASVLVIGFGRLGKVLAQRFKSLGADVTVSARSYSDKSWISVYGYRAADTGSLGPDLSTYDVVINTVPALILTHERLLHLKSDCLLIDLASVPGGTDFNAASELQIKTEWALSLPGKVAPLTSARIILDTISNMLNELEENPV